MPMPLTLRKTNFITILSIMTIFFCILQDNLFFKVSAQKLDKEQLANQVKQEFLHAWNGYKKYAWGHDELKPLSKSYNDWYAEPFYMTPLDALDTMILMGLQDEADSTREFIATRLSFDKDVFVSNFEFTIRFLGGLLTSYQMTGDERLLRLAKDLADRQLAAFKTPTGMPYGEVNLKTGAVRRHVTNPAETGTLLIEFGTLSKLTGDTTYYHIVKHAFIEQYRLRSDIGLVGDAIDVLTGKWESRSSHISGCIDSYYEYMLKCSILFDDDELMEMWNTSSAAVNRYLADERFEGLWYGHADMVTGKRTETHYGSLDAFWPAVLAMSGDLERATRLQESSMKMWNRYGIEPEQIDYSTMNAVYPGYYLRPEIIESAYYLYQYTGNEKYLQMGKIFLENLRIYCRTESGYAELKSVITKEKNDAMQSFFLAETLKYLYLLFAPPETLDFKSIIFNTEAHAIRKTW